MSAMEKLLLEYKLSIELSQLIDGFTKAMIHGIKYILRMFKFITRG